MLRLSPAYEKIRSTGGKDTMARLLKLNDTNFDSMCEGDVIKAVEDAIQLTKLPSGSDVNKLNTQCKFEYVLIRHMIDAIISWNWDSKFFNVHKVVMGLNPQLYTSSLRWNSEQINRHEPPARIPNC